jgi:hypothetical protein
LAHLRHDQLLFSGFNERTMSGTSKIGWFGPAVFLRLFSSDLVIHVGRNEGDGLSRLACGEHFIPGGFATADGDA